MLPHMDAAYNLARYLTRDPAAIEASRRPLPIGFWKGSGLSVMLDLIAATLSGGRATHEIAGTRYPTAGMASVNA